MNTVRLRFKILSNKYIGKYLIKKNYKKYSAFTSNRWGGDSFDNEIQRNFAIFLSPKEQEDVKLKDNLKVDIIWCYYRYGATPNEYFLFGFRSLNVIRRSEFLTVKHKDDVMREKVGMGENWELLEDKYKFYQRFKRFFKREVLLFDQNCSKEQFEKFIEKRARFIAKPIGGQCGRGIEIFSIAEYKNIDSLYDELKLRGTSCLLEEVITQSDELAAINRSSVNTIRFPSFINTSGFHVLKPCLRIGRAGCIVDNAGSGGIVCVIDENTGVIVSDGADELGNTYEVHPDSKHELKGWSIPKWKDLLEFAEEVHRTIEFYPYVGWDFALTDKGWVLIEGNWGQFLSELVDHEGIKKRFDAMFD